MRLLLLFCFLSVIGFCGNTSRFIVQSGGSEKVQRSRNEVKEDIGNSLRVIAETGATIQSVVGKMTMQFAALQRVLVTQVGALVEDSEPFNTASTTKLSVAQNQLEKHVIELERIGREIEGLAARVRRTVSLEAEII